MNGKETPDDSIQVGGFSFGGFELNLGSRVYGVMFLTDNPSEQYIDTTHATRVETFESFNTDSSSMRVFFATGKAEVRAKQSDDLNEYLLGVVANSGL
jgi:hypothetical protein